jgi:hypothetical protein
LQRIIMEWRRITRSVRLSCGQVLSRPGSLDAGFYRGFSRGRDQVCRLTPCGRAFGRDGRPGTASRAKTIMHASRLRGWTMQATYQRQLCIATTKNGQNVYPVATSLRRGFTGSSTRRARVRARDKGARDVKNSRFRSEMISPRRLAADRGEITLLMRWT